MKEITISIVLSLLLFGCTPTNTKDNKDITTATVIEENVIHVEPSIQQAPLPKNISPMDAFNMINDANVMILDVRTQPEIAMDGKIANSQLIPVQVLSQYLDRLDRSKTILVYCHTGNRSLYATDMLRSQGFNAINVVGGINAWKASGLPVE